MCVRTIGLRVLQWHVFVFSAANVWLVTNIAHFESRLRIAPAELCAFAE